MSRVVSAQDVPRYAAKNIVAACLAGKCEVQLAYAIGMVHPVSVMINTFGTSVISPGKIAEIMNDTFDFRPAEIIKQINLLRPVYAPTSAYGHFGREEDGFTWEKTDKADMLKE